MRRIFQRPTPAATNARATRTPAMTTMLRLAISFLAALIGACKPPPVADALLVVDPADLEAKGDGKLFRVDQAKGGRTLLSDFADEAQGPQGVDPFGLAVEASGQLVITDPNAGTESKGALFRIDPGTGTRSLLRDFGDPAQGAEGMNPFGVAVEPKGFILVTDPGAGTDAKGALFRLDPKNGARTILSDFGVPQDSPNSGIGGVAVDGKGQILITDTSAGTDAKGVLWRVHSGSGARTVLSDFGDPGQGPQGADPFGVAIEASEQILVTDPNAGTESKGALFRVDPGKGTRSLLSDFGDPAQGPEEPEGPLSLVGVAVGSSGEIFVTSIDAGTESKGALFRVDPATGVRRLLSDFGRTKQGPLGQDPTGVVVQ
ncbi:MAG: hypothetical protein ACREV4_09600 [Gammaproteobacteria bacterium]